MKLRIICENNCFAISSGKKEAVPHNDNYIIKMTSISLLKWNLKKT